MILAQISKEFRNCKIVILGLYETIWKESGDQKKSNGDSFLLRETTKWLAVACANKPRQQNAISNRQHR